MDTNQINSVIDQWCVTPEATTIVYILNTISPK